LQSFRCSHVHKHADIKGKELTSTDDLNLVRLDITTFNDRK